MVLPRIIAAALNLLKYGLKMPHDPSEKRRYSLFSKTLKSCVDPVLRPIIKTQGAAASKLITEWPEIVGNDIAAYSAPIRLQFPKDKNSGGTLYIACEGAHALTLQHMAPMLIERLTMYFGYPAVARIMLEQTLISREPTTKPKPTSRKTAPPINTDCLADIEDEELKKVLTDFATTLNRK
jgi:hypothetical protein